MPSSDEVKVACLFDLDGTLLDFEEASFGALNTALGDLRDPSTGCEVTGKMHVSIIGTRKEHWSKQLLEEAKVPPSKLTPEQYVKNWEKALEAQYPKLGLMPGTIEMLAFLKKHSIPAALATSSDRATCDQKLAYQKDIRDAMQFVITGSDVDNGKPAPDPFLAAAKGLGVPIEKCVVFEDAPSGVKSGRAAGATVFAMVDKRFSDGSHEWFGLADEKLDSLVDAIPLLTKMLEK